jgi:hypothetical protein
MGTQTVKRALTGGLLFTPEQSKRIQAEVEKRASVQNSRLYEQRISKVHQPAEPERIRPAD